MSGTGCLNKLWSYDFTAAFADIDDWYHYITGSYSVDGDGLFLSNGAINPPHYFVGDMSLKIYFSLNVFEGHTLSMEIGFSDDLHWEGGNEIWASLFALGDDDGEWWQLGDYGIATDQDNQIHPEDVPHLLRNGLNTVEIKKIGNILSLTVNGYPTGQMTIVNFQGVHLFPTISTSTAEVDRILIKKVEVRYSGDISIEWPVI